MKRKLAIITFHSAYNFGAIMQAFALQKYLNDNFGETQILDYRNSKVENSYKLPTIGFFLKKPKSALNKISQYFLYKNKRAEIDEFISKFPTTKRYNEKNINDAGKEADVFIAGSDQIWNYMLTGKDGHYFLDFVQDKICCSYAASFGISEIPDSMVEFYIRNLKKFDAISVREEQGARIVADLIGTECKVLPDPTLLIDREIWEKECADQKLPEHYIFLYKITNDNNLIPFAKQLSKKTGFPIIYAPNNLKRGLIGKTVFSLGPREWLNYIRRADYVVTNSFHGTTFSIIFQKKFYCEVIKKPGVASSRLENLLSLFHMESRIIGETVDPKEEPDWEATKQIQLQEKQRAFDYFAEVLSDI